MTRLTYAWPPPRTIAASGAGATKREIGETLRMEEVRRGLTFEYALITLGASHNRAPSDQAWKEGEVLSLDSGGNYNGYIGDLCRMAVLGTPDSELEDLLDEVQIIQQAARGAIRADVLGQTICEAANPVLAASPSAANLRFVANGMGLVSHEAPRLTAAGNGWWQRVYGRNRVVPRPPRTWHQVLERRHPARIDGHYRDAGGITSKRCH